MGEVCGGIGVWAYRCIGVGLQIVLVLVLVLELFLSSPRGWLPNVLQKSSSNSRSMTRTSTRTRKTDLRALIFD
jgi:hypothetical protein